MILNNDVVVYLDMDGVLADFDFQIFKDYGVWLDNIDNKQKNKILTDIFQKRSEEFFSNLPKTPRADELFRLVCRHADRVLILSSTGHTNSEQIEVAKRQWLTDNDFNVDVCFVQSSRDKQFYAEMNYVLVDDNVQKCILPFAKAGGYGVYYDVSKHDASMDKLAILLEELKEAYNWQQNWCKHNRVNEDSPEAHYKSREAFETYLKRKL